MLTERRDWRVLGFYTLSSSTIALDELPVKLARKLARYPQLPATPLGCLPVDQPAHWMGYGALVLLDALKRGLEAANEIGAMAVIVDAKDDSAVACYAQYGFDPLLENQRRMILRMGDAAQLFV